MAVNCLYFVSELQELAVENTHDQRKIMPAFEHTPFRIDNRVCALLGGVFRTLFNPVGRHLARSSEYLADQGRQGGVLLSAAPETE